MSDFGTEMKDLIVSNIGGTFPKTLERLAVWAETDKYKWKEDESVWNQKRGRTAPQYEAHFDNQFICFFDSSKSKQFCLMTFLSALNELYKEGKIYVHPEIYAVKEAERQALADKDILEIPKARNEAEEMIVNVIKKQSKRKKRKVVEK